MKRAGVKRTKTPETKEEKKPNLLSEQQDKQTKAHGHKGWARHKWLM